MILMPREKPVIADLNSYYLNLERLIEHFQGQLGSGGVYLHAPSTAAAVFFDETSIINGIYQSGETLLRGQKAIETIFDVAAKDNFTVAVYRIAPVNVYFWASLSHAEPIYKDLSSEFTDLEGLIKKMRNERLTGFIEVSTGDKSQGGLLFFNNGNLVETSCSWKKADAAPQSDQDRLVQLSRQGGGVFNVSRIALAEANNEAVRVGSSPAPAQETAGALAMAQDLLAALEKSVVRTSRHKIDFDTLLRRKFIEKADKYSFLDPFAAEFTYAGGRIDYTGQAGDAELCQAVVVCVREIIQQLGLADTMRQDLSAWRRRYDRELQQFDIVI